MPGVSLLILTCDRVLEFLTRLSVETGPLSRNGCWGFIIIDSQGIHYSSTLGQVSHFIWEETRPLRAVLFVSGDHRSQEGALYLHMKQD